MDIEARMAKALSDIEELGILDIDVEPGALNLDLIESVIKIIRENKDWLDKQAKSKKEWN